MNKTIRWVCPSCKRKWIQPVEKCVYCKTKTEKEIGCKLKVIGITKVYVPSVMHPIVPYNILLLEDEFGNKMPKKCIRDYSIGDEYVAKSSNNSHAVSITKIKYDVYEAVTEALELIGGLEISKETRILIKPNIMASIYPYLGAVTHPSTVEAVISYLINNGASAESINLAEQCIYNPLDDALAKSGIGKLCIDSKIKFINIAETEFAESSIGNTKVRLSKLPLDYDLIINMPVLKTHLLFGISGALENMTRFITKESLAMLQSITLEISENIVMINKMLPKYITVADGVVGMQGNGPLNGEPAFLNYILASRDPVALDSVFAQLGMFTRIPKYLAIAEKVGIGTADISKIPVVGNEINAVARELKPAIGSKLLKS